MSDRLLLDARELTVAYGGVTALDAVTLGVAPGAVVGLIGPNGAGKTTFIDTICGFTPTRHGHLYLDGAEIGSEAPHQRARRGLVRTFQSLELFDDLSVRDNLLVGVAPPSLSEVAASFVRAERHDRRRGEEVLAFLGLADVAHRRPTELANGTRHLVALARALVARPRVVLLDEPAAGLDPHETDALAEHLRRLPEEGISVLVVDHDMSLIMGVCDTVNVLDFGRVIASGSPAQVRSDPEVIAAYLGHASGEGS